EGYLFPIRWIYERSDLGNECFDLLVNVVASNKEPQIRTRAAYDIRNYVELNETRIARLQGVINSCPDREITRILTEALAKQRGG
ncbi:MAG: hypothetical protein ACYTBJ_19890, partial [Planctomycetota bacterium]